MVSKTQFWSVPVACCWFKAVGLFWGKRAVTPAVFCRGLMVREPLSVLAVRSFTIQKRCVWIYSVVSLVRLNVCGLLHGIYFAIWFRSRVGFAEIWCKILIPSNLVPYICLVALQRMLLTLLDHKMWFLMCLIMIVLLMVCLTSNVVDMGDFVKDVLDHQAPYMCHVCGRYGHDAIKCWYHFDQSFNSILMDTKHHCTSICTYALSYVRTLWE